MTLALSPAELLRYARHLSLPGVGPDGQVRLKAARVAVIGAGGLGSPAALYLAAAGVGTLGLVDFDRVDVSNLQRQVLHGTGAVGLPKVQSGAERLADLNPHVRVVPVEERLTAANARDILAEFDIVVDGSDNFPTRYLVNDVCVWLGRPLVYGSIFRFEGQVAVFHAASGPCYRCLYAEPPPLRRASVQFPRIASEQGSRLPRVRTPALDHGADRLRGVLRIRRAGRDGRR